MAETEIEWEQLNIVLEISWDKNQRVNFLLWD